MSRELRLTWTHHADYYGLALDMRARIREIKREHDALEATLATAKDVADKDEIADQLAAKNDAIGNLALVVVIFAAFTLEAYINHHAIARLCKSYLKNYLDKLDLVAKCTGGHCTGGCCCLR